MARGWLVSSSSFGVVGDAMDMFRRLNRYRKHASAMARRCVAYVDPIPEPGAPRVSTAFIVCFGALLSITGWMLVRGKYLPGTDMPYHALCSRVWMEAGALAGPYSGYEPRHIFEANTLLYTSTSVLGHVFGSFTAYRIANAYYFIGVPLACLYALRAFNRSVWGSLLGFPLCYNESFSSGYVNFNFAAPTFILAIALYVRFTRRPTWQRGAVIALLFLAVFLSHAQVYLWLGALVMVFTIIGLWQRFHREEGWLRALRKTGRLALSCGLASALSLFVFYRWYARGYGQGRAVGGEFNSSTLSWLPLVNKLTGGMAQTFASSLHPWEYHFIVGLGVVVALSWGLARAEGDRGSAIPELALLLTVISYYVVPDYIAAQYVAPRQWYVTGWLIPITVVPVAPRISRARWALVVGAILAWTFLRMTVIVDYMTKLEDEEMRGLDNVVAQAPREPGLLVTYAAPDPNSKYFKTSYGHTYAFLAAERGYDSPLELSDKSSIAPVRYTVGPPLPIARSFSNPAWYGDPTIWQYDLVLVRRWVPSPQQRRAAQERGDLVAASGDWELWRRRGPKR